MENFLQLGIHFNSSEVASVDHLEYGYKGEQDSFGKEGESY